MIEIGSRVVLVSKEYIKWHSAYNGDVGTVVNIQYTKPQYCFYGIKFDESIIVETNIGNILYLSRHEIELIKI